MTAKRRAHSGGSGRSRRRPSRPAGPGLRDSTRLRLHYELLRVRRIEEALAELYQEQEMRTPAHFSIGQEAVAVGVCAALTAQDVVYSGHRCHAHYLAKGGDLAGSSPSSTAARPDAPGAAADPSI